MELGTEDYYYLEHQYEDASHEAIMAGEYASGGGKKKRNGANNNANKAHGGGEDDDSGGDEGGTVSVAAGGRHAAAAAARAKRKALHKSAQQAAVDQVRLIGTGGNGLGGAGGPAVTAAALRRQRIAKIQDYSLRYIVRCRLPPPEELEAEERQREKERKEKEALLMGASFRAGADGSTATAGSAKNGGAAASPPPPPPPPLSSSSAAAAGPPSSSLSALPPLEDRITVDHLEQLMLFFYDHTAIDVQSLLQKEMAAMKLRARETTLTNLVKGQGSEWQLNTASLRIVKEGGRPSLGVSEGSYSSHGGGGGGGVHSSPLKGSPNRRRHPSSPSVAHAVVEPIEGATTGNSGGGGPPLVSLDDGAPLPNVTFMGSSNSKSTALAEGGGHGAVGGSSFSSNVTGFSTTPPPTYPNGQPLNRRYNASLSYGTGAARQMLSTTTLARRRKLLDEDAFIAAMQAVLGHSVATTAECKSWFKQINFDSSGVISWDDFSAFLLSLGEHRTHVDSRPFALGIKLYPTACHPWNRHSGPITCCVVHPTNGTLYTGGEDGLVLAWSAATLRNQALVHRGTSWVVGLQLMHDGRLAAATVERELMIFDLRSNEMVRSYKGKCDLKGEMGMSYAFSSGTTVSVNEKLVGHLTPKHHKVTSNRADNKEKYRRLKSGAASHMPMSSDEVAMISKGAKEDRTNDTKQLEQSSLLGLDEAPTCMDYHYSAIDQDLLFFGTRSGAVIIYDISNSHDRVVRCFYKMQLHSKRVNKVEVIPLLEGLLTCSDDCSLKLTSLETGQVIREFTRENGGHSLGVTSFVYSQTCKIFISVSGERRALVWDYLQEAPIYALEEHSAPLLSACINERDRQIITLSSDNTVRISDLMSHKTLQTVCHKSASHRPSSSVTGTGVGGGVSGNGGGAEGGELAPNFVTMLFDQHRHRHFVLSSFPQVYKLRQSEYTFPSHYSGHVEPVVHASYCPLFKQLVTFDAESAIVWESGTGTARFSYPYTRDFSTAIEALKLTATGWDDTQRRMLCGYHQGTLVVWNYANGQALNVIHDTSVDHSMSRYGTEVAAVCSATVGGAAMYIYGVGRRMLYCPESQQFTVQRASSYELPEPFGALTALGKINNHLIAIGTSTGALLVYNLSIEAPEGKAMLASDYTDGFPAMGEGGAATSTSTPAAASTQQQEAALNSTAAFNETTSNRSRSTSFAKNATATLMAATARGGAGGGLGATVANNTSTTNPNAAALGLLTGPPQTPGHRASAFQSELKRQEAITTSRVEKVFVINKESLGAPLILVVHNDGRGVLWHAAKRTFICSMLFAGAGGSSASCFDMDAITHDTLAYCDALGNVTVWDIVYEQVSLMDTLRRHTRNPNVMADVREFVTNSHETIPSIERRSAIRSCFHAGHNQITSVVVIPSAHETAMANNKASSMSMRRKNTVATGSREGGNAFNTSADRSNSAGGGDKGGSPPGGVGMGLSVGRRERGASVHQTTAPPSAEGSVNANRTAPSMAAGGRGRPSIATAANSRSGGRIAGGSLMVGAGLQHGEVSFLSSVESVVFEPVTKTTSSSNAAKLQQSSSSSVTPLAPSTPATAEGLGAAAGSPLHSATAAVSFNLASSSGNAAAGSPSPSRHGIISGNGTVYYEPTIATCGADCMVRLWTVHGACIGEYGMRRWSVEKPMTWRSTIPEPPHEGYVLRDGGGGDASGAADLYSKSLSSLMTGGGGGGGGDYQRRRRRQAEEEEEERALAAVAADATVGGGSSAATTPRRASPQAGGGGGIGRVGGGTDSFLPPIHTPRGGAQHAIISDEPFHVPLKGPAANKALQTVGYFAPNNAAVEALVKGGGGEGSFRTAEAALLPPPHHSQPLPLASFGGSTATAAAAADPLLMASTTVNAMSIRGREHELLTTTTPRPAAEGRHSHAHGAALGAAITAGITVSSSGGGGGGGGVEGLLKPRGPAALVASQTEGFLDASMGALGDFSFMRGGVATDGSSVGGAMGSGHFASPLLRGTRNQKRGGGGLLSPPSSVSRAVGVAAVTPMSSAALLGGGGGVGGSDDGGASEDDDSPLSLHAGNGNGGNCSRKVGHIPSPPPLMMSETAPGGALDGASTPTSTTSGRKLLSHYHHQHAGVGGGGSPSTGGTSPIGSGATMSAAAQSQPAVKRTIAQQRRLRQQQEEEAAAAAAAEGCHALAPLDAVANEGEGEGGDGGIVLDLPHAIAAAAHARGGGEIILNQRPPPSMTASGGPSPLLHSPQPPPATTTTSCSAPSLAYQGGASSARTPHRPSPMFLPPPPLSPAGMSAMLMVVPNNNSNNANNYYNNANYYNSGGSSASAVLSQSARGGLGFHSPLRGDRTAPSSPLSSPSSQSIGAGGGAFPHPPPPPPHMASAFNSASTTPQHRSLNAYQMVGGGGASTVVAVPNGAGGSPSSHSHMWPLTPSQPPMPLSAFAASPLTHPSGNATGRGSAVTINHANNGTAATNLSPSAKAQQIAMNVVRARHDKLEQYGLDRADVRRAEAKVHLAESRRARRGGEGAQGDRFRVERVSAAEQLRNRIAARDGGEGYHDDGLDALLAEADAEDGTAPPSSSRGPSPHYQQQQPNRLSNGIDTILTLSSQMVVVKIDEVRPPERSAEAQEESRRGGRRIYGVKAAGQSVAPTFTAPGAGGRGDGARK